MNLATTLQPQITELAKITGSVPITMSQYTIDVSEDIYDLLVAGGYIEDILPELYHYTYTIGNVLEIMAHTLTIEIEFLNKIMNKINKIKEMQNDTN